MNVWKPYFVYRPSQALRRIIRVFWQPKSTVVRLPWGSMLKISPQEAVGRAIWFTGVHEIATTEAIFRLLPKGGVGVDVGANIGYMTSAMLAAVGEHGTVIACEPHPQIFDALNANARLSRPTGNGLILLNLAASDSKGEAMLSLDPESDNQGTGTLSEKSGVPQTRVATNTLDALIGDLNVDLLKLDVEGHELSVLKGARQLIAQKKVLNIIYEDHCGSESSIHPWLAEFGYTVFQLNWETCGPKLNAPGSGSSHASYQAQDYLASFDPNRLVRTFESKGWRCLAE